MDDACKKRLLLHCLSLILHFIHQLRCSPIMKTNFIRNGNESGKNAKTVI